MLRRTDTLLLRGAGVQAAEFHWGSPANKMTPLSKQKAKKIFSMHAEDVAQLGTVQEDMEQSVEGAWLRVDLLWHTAVFCA